MVGVGGKSNKHLFKMDIKKKTWFIFQVYLNSCVLFVCSHLISIKFIQTLQIELIKH